ncbi:MAG TPA: hypothetical protein VHU23_19395 [Rhizomicrobium sp.]|jgi:hypothetical protein|nr:hypothetical protein [Rhizomicrobium sp.]
MITEQICETVNQTESAERYRELAVDTLVRSEKAGSPDARMHYLLLAAHWYERALECEGHPELAADETWLDQPH